MISKIIILGMVLTCSVASAKTIQLGEKTITINSDLDFGLLEKADTLERFSRTQGDIWIVINSYGGMVDPTLNFIDAMRMAKYRGRQIYCVVTTAAMSGAFYIASQCNKLFAFPNSKLLFHPFGMGTRGRLDYVLSSAKMVRRWESIVKRDIRKSLCFSQKKFNKHYNNESLWLAIILHKKCNSFVTIINNIEGYNGNLFEQEEKGIGGLFEKNKRTIPNVYNNN